MGKIAQKVANAGFPYSFLVKYIVTLNIVAFLLERAGGFASREALEEIEFNVVKTGRDPNQYTVTLPNPITSEIARRFNRLFEKTR